MLLHDTPSEALIQFCWKILRKELRLLTTQIGKPVQVIHPGTWNTNQGPDFLNAHIQMEGIHFHGHIELHIDGEDWYRHKHHLDPHYNNTILHIVWKHTNRPVIREDGTAIPECEINALVPSLLLRKVDELRLANAPIPCASMVPYVSGFYKELALTSMSIERIRRKAKLLEERLSATTANWGQVLWEELAMRMGGTVNGEAFREVAQRVPLSIWRHYQHNHLQLEALFLGASGMLPLSAKEAYVNQLLEAWAYLQHKHRIDPIPRVAIKLMRMRPASFPTIRFSQLASLLLAYPSLTELFISESWPFFLRRKISASIYWDTHYTFGTITKPKKKNLGKAQKHSLLINTLIPLGYLFTASHKNTDLHSWIEDGLTTIPPEHNRITKLMQTLSFPNDHALHSQGLIELYKQYCIEKKCLSCSIGYQILSPFKQTR
ncbi:MAG: DUF2851 family protein [Bacteroidota bacterium]